MRRSVFSIIALSILFMTLSCNNDDDDNGNEQIIDLVILDQKSETPSSVLADGETIITLKATIPLEADDSITEVEFRKSSGEFLGIEGATIMRPLNDSNEAQIAVQVPNSVKQLYFNASISFDNKNFVAEADIALSRAYADEIFLEPSKLIVTIPNTITLETFLIRNTGTVSIGTKASFEAIQIVNNEELSVGRFTNLSNAETNSDGQITVSFVTDTGDIDTALPVIIRVLSQNDAGDSVQSSVSINLN